MKQEIKSKLEAVVELLNNPDTTIMDNELIEKLEHVIELVKAPSQSQKTKALLQEVEQLIDNVMVNPDIELEYHITDSNEAYIDLKYIASGTHVMKQKLPIKDHYLTKSPQDLANLLTFYIEQFIEQIDSVESGAQ
jgi:hypothetical protein